MAIGMRKIAAAITVVLAIGTAEVISASTASAGIDSIVVTDKGAVQGSVTATNRTFLGIPYAAPPIGNLRWKPPAPATAWPGVRNATQVGNKCAQVEELAGDAQEGSEDCLNLNVYEPSSVTAVSNLPVMVFIHGGGYVFGSNADVDPRLLAQTENIIVVTMNYRLGALGYLDLPGLASENAASAGNFGLLDQQAALRWVKTNIARFGGDSTRTTLSGESTGGAAVWANVISPGASGLFQRAIIESGAGVGFTTTAKAQADGATFANNVGCADPATQLACLRGLDVSTILGTELAAAPPILLADDMIWAPSVGGSLLPKAPAAAFAAGTYNKVAILQGTNHDEWRLFAAALYQQGRPLTDASYVGLTYSLFGARAPEVLAHYPSSNYSSPTAAYAAYAGDEGFICPARTADQAVSTSVPTYAYEFNDQNAPPLFTIPGFPLGAYHTAELLYVFPRTGFPGMTPDQVGLSRQIMAYWGNFVSHSSPIGAGLPVWLPYNGFTDQVLSLAPNNTEMIGTFAADHQCAFWSTFGI